MSDDWKRTFIFPSVTRFSPRIDAWQSNITAPFIDKERRDHHHSVAVDGAAAPSKSPR